MNSHHKTGSLVIAVLVVVGCLVIGLSTKDEQIKTLMVLAASAAIITWLYLHGGEAADGKDFSQDDKG